MTFILIFRTLWSRFISSTIA